jgi:RNA polymerase sigma-70 factor (ECF subfamily)
MTNRDHDQPGAADPFDEHRGALFAVAYRMLGSVADAEDIVQDAFLRWREAARDDVESPRAFLTTIVTRLCIDHLRSARVRREEYVGPWLPEPVLVAEAPEEPVEMAESLSMAFLVLLESLTPAERAALLLREVFDYEYAEVAKILGKTEANCRQLVRRARERVAEGRPRFDASIEAREALTHRFLAACATGDLEGLLGLLSSEVTLYSDGGGKVRAALNPIRGADRVARFLVGIARKAPEGISVRPAIVNGEAGFVATVDGATHSVWTFRFGASSIDAIYVVNNPDKLKHVAA